MFTIQSNDVTGEVVIFGNPIYPPHPKSGYTIEQVNALPPGAGKLVKRNGLLARDAILPMAVVAPAEIDLQKSPLWPLQQALRASLAQVTDFDTMASLQASVVTIEGTFSKWRISPSLTFLRNIIRSIIEQTDVSDDALLTDLKSAMLSSPRWNDTLSS